MDWIATAKVVGVLVGTVCVVLTGAYVVTEVIDRMLGALQRRTMRRIRRKADKLEQKR